MTESIDAGLLGAVFNHLVETLNTFRCNHINHTPWKRAVEALLIVIFHCTIMIVLPKAFSCQSNTVEDVINHDVDIKCFDLQLLSQFTEGTKTVEQTRYQNGYKTEFQSKLVFKTGVGENSTTVVSGYEENEADKEYAGANDFEYNKCNAYCRSIPLEIDNLQSYSCKREDEFNPLATLMLNYGGNAVKLLFKRGMQDLFHAEALLTACIFYFLMAAMVCGMCIPRYSPNTIAPICILVLMTTLCFRPRKRSEDITTLQSYRDAPSPSPGSSLHCDRSPLTGCL